MHRIKRSIGVACIRLAAFVLPMTIGLGASFTLAHAQEQYFDLLDQAARNGAIADGFGYSNRESSRSQTNVYVVRSSKEAANGVNFIAISFYEHIRQPRPILSVSFERCGSAVDTATMFEYLRGRPLLITHIDAIDATLEGMGKVHIADALDIREVSKSVTRWDDQSVRYDRTDQIGDAAPSTYSRSYIFVWLYPT